MDNRIPAAIEPVDGIAADLRLFRQSVWSDAVEQLIRSAEAELMERYPDYVPTPFQAEEAEQKGTALFVARLDDFAVGCIVVRPWVGAEAEYQGAAELKRLWVAPRARGLGIAKALLRDAEAWAARSGYTTLVLETGLAQPEAMQLYIRCGYTRIRCWGDYGDDPVSACYKKTLLPG